MSFVATTASQIVAKCRPLSAITLKNSSFKDPFVGHSFLCFTLEFVLGDPKSTSKPSEAANSTCHLFKAYTICGIDADGVEETWFILYIFSVLERYKLRSCWRCFETDYFVASTALDGARFEG